MFVIKEVFQSFHTFTIFIKKKPGKKVLNLNNIFRMHDTNYYDMFLN